MGISKLDNCRYHIKIIGGRSNGYWILYDTPMTTYPSWGWFTRGLLRAGRRQSRTPPQCAAPELYWEVHCPFFRNASVIGSPVP